MKTLQKLLGPEVFTSSLIVFTKYKNLKKEIRKELEEDVVSKLGKPYVYWDSKNKLDGQFEKL